MSSPGSTEQQIEAWLETVRVDGGSDRPTAHATIVPRLRMESVRRAESFLALLAERGESVELRPGRVIGEGGMGLVREAEQVALRRVVATKTAKPGSSDPSAARDLLAEAWVTGALEHPNIIPVHHLTVDEQGMPLLILKRIDGVEWSALCRDAEEVERRFGAGDLLAWNLGILDQVLNALRFAHSVGVIHRDLKPQNVMIGQFGEVYLLDWGLAASLRDDGTGRFTLASEASGLAGTPCYMAPEMLARQGDPPLSERTDVYLAGAVLFELIAGRPPHLGKSAIEVIAQVVMSRPELPAGGPAELGRICRRAMEPDPSDRFESIDALQLALRGYLEHRGSARLLRGASERLTTLTALASGRDPKDREEIHRQLAICRFAFHEALAAWHDNAAAQAGLTRAHLAVAEYELALGDPQAAVTILSQLEERPALLAEAQAAALAQAEKRRRLEHLGRDADPTVSARTRGVAIALGLAFVVAPLLTQIFPRLALASHARQVAWSTGCLVLLLLIGWWYGRTPMTAVNRFAFAAGRLLFVAQTVLALGLWALGMPPGEAPVLHLFLWATVSGMFAFTAGRWFAIISASYFAGFLFAAHFPEFRWYTMSATNLVFVLFVVGGWRSGFGRPEPKRS